MNLAVFPNSQPYGCIRQVPVPEQPRSYRLARPGKPRQRSLHRLIEIAFASQLRLVFSASLFSSAGLRKDSKSYRNEARGFLLRQQTKGQVGLSIATMTGYDFLWMSCANAVDLPSLRKRTGSSRPNISMSTPTRPVQPV